MLYEVITAFFFHGNIRQTRNHRFSFEFAIDGNLPFLIIDGNIGIGLENPDLAHGFPTDPAGRDIGDTAVFELQAGIGDIDFRGKHRHADGIDGFDRTADDAQDDIDVIV